MILQNQFSRFIFFFRGDTLNISSKVKGGLEDVFGVVYERGPLTVNLYRAF